MAGVLNSRRREDCTYTSCYCEENIWQLAKRCQEEAHQHQDVLVVFISSQASFTPLWHQRKSKAEDDPVLWDYHVILLSIPQSTQKKDGREHMSALVYDLDSRLPFPCPATKYILETFRPDLQIKETHRQLLRIVDSSSFLNRFSSDRSHMKKADGSWSSPPPEYPPIRAPGGEKMNLSRWLDVGQDRIKDIKHIKTDAWGSVVSVEQLLQYISQKEN